MKAISSMATRRLLADLAIAAESAGLPHLEVESVGGVDAARRVAAGEVLDAVFLAEDALIRLAADGHVDAASISPLVRSQVAVAVPSGTEEPAISVDGTAFADSAGIRSALLAASRIGYSTGPSGTALVRSIEDWNLRGELSDRLVQAQPGIPVAKLLADGEVDLGFQQLSELIGQPGVRILGVLPADCAIDTVFAGAVATASVDRATSHDLLDFLSSDVAERAKLEHGFQSP